MEGNKRRGGNVDPALEREFKNDEDEAVLMRSERFMEYNERDFNEYFSDEGEEEKKDGGSDVDLDAGDSEVSLGDKAKSMVFLPFKPGI